MLEKLREFKFPLDIQFFADDADDEVVEEQPIEEEQEDNNEIKDTPQPIQTKTFTQDEVSRMMAREKRQGRSSAYNELGIDMKDKGLVEAVKNFVSTQVQPTNGEDEKLAQMQDKMLTSTIKAEALGLEANPQFVDDLVVLVKGQIQNPEDIDEVKEILGQMKTKYPNFYRSISKDKDEDKGKRGTGSSLGGKKNKKDNQTLNLGQTLAANKLQATKRSGLFGKK